MAVSLSHYRFCLKCLQPSCVMLVPLFQSFHIMTGDLVKRPFRELTEIFIHYAAKWVVTLFDWNIHKLRAPVIAPVLCTCHTHYNDQLLELMSLSTLNLADGAHIDKMSMYGTYIDRWSREKEPQFSTCNHSNVSG